jgi:hypothetical protein
MGLQRVFFDSAVFRLLRVFVLKKWQKTQALKITARDLRPAKSKT